MKDTPPEIIALQQKIWLSKTPEERLRQFAEDNDAFWKMTAELRYQVKLEQGIPNARKETLLELLGNMDEVLQKKNERNLATPKGK